MSSLGSEKSQIFKGREGIPYLLGASFWTPLALGLP